LGSLSFVVPEVNGLVVRASPERRPFLVVTTNEERDLADAFLRRCIEHRIRMPDAATLYFIGLAHLPGLDKEVHDAVVALNPQSTAEYLDALHACQALLLSEATEKDREALISAVFNKPLRSDVTSGA
jgi:hypothetical protein